MKLLVIGGTRFVGRHLVDAALQRGWAVTVFNRGQSGPAPTGVDVRRGDRRASLEALAQGEWDAVVDTCGYLPREVAQMAQCLKGRVGCYAFVSSISAYAAHALPNREDSPMARFSTPEQAQTDVVDGDTYGPLKALCEAEVRAAFGEQGLLLRPGLIVGPHDPTQRFTWWPARLGRALPGEQVLVPGPPEAPVQFIDVRDLAAFTLHCIAQRHRGAFNVVLPAGRLTRATLMAACAEAAGARVRWAWADADVLQAQGLQLWSDLPLALPAAAELAALMDVDGRRAAHAGLVTRSLAATVADTLAWHRSLPAAQQAFTQAGISAEREAQILATLERAGVPVE